MERIVDCADPERIILFGSRAQGSGGPNSDHDVLVIKNGVPNTLHLAQDLYVAMHGIGVPVDIIVATDEIIERNKHKFWMVYKYALEEGKVIYD